jgi:hypothetical protein
MKAIAIFFTCWLGIAPTLMSQQSHSPEQNVQQVIHDVFQAFSDASLSKMEQVVTTDVKILEHGEVWTLDSIRFYFDKPRPADFRRINKLEFFQTEVKENMAFVSYWNSAEIRANNKDRKVKWLESAVLVMEGGRWRVRMLHSTRVQY